MNQVINNKIILYLIYITHTYSFLSSRKNLLMFMTGLIMTQVFLKNNYDTVNKLNLHNM